MFYAASSQQFSKEKAQGTDSALDTGHVFTGEYWDDFALLGAERFRRILVLGAGFGACLRPLLTASPNARITLVDIDAGALEMTETIHHRHFPDLGFDTVVADADDITAVSETYDLIWIDLFDHRGYADCLRNRAYYPRLAHRLAPGGMIAINAFTVATSLSARKCLSDSERYFASVLAESFSVVRRIPYRRNVTLVASQGPLPSPAPCADLRPLDALIQRLARLRLAYALSAPVEVGPARLPSFSEISREMGMGWDALLPQIDVDSLSARLQSPHLSAATLADIALELGDELPLLAVLAGSLSTGSDALALAYSNLILERGREWFEADAALFVNYLFAQWGALHARSRRIDPVTVAAAERLLEFCEAGGKNGQFAISGRR